MTPYSHAASLLPGLPATRLSPAAQRSGATRSRQLGATQTNLSRPYGSVSVAGQPSLKLERMTGGGVRASLLRKIPFLDLLSDAELRPLRALLSRAQGRAEALSQGGLSTRELARRGNPYGRGARRGGGRRGGLGRLQGGRRGVSNLSVVNRQSGELARLWRSELERSKDGVRLNLSNSTQQAEWTSFGTPRMRAHGPVSTAVVQQLPAINQEVQRLARVARARAQELGVR